MKSPLQVASEPRFPRIRRGIAGAVALQLPSKRLRIFDTAIVKLDRLGDFVLALSAIRNVIDQGDPSGTLLIVSPWAAALARLEFPGVEILTLPAELGTAQMVRQAGKIRRALRGLSVSRVVCFRHHRADYDEVVLSLINAPVSFRIEYQTTGWRPATRRCFQYKGRGLVGLEDGSAIRAGESNLCHELEIHRQLVSAVSGGTVSAESILPELTAIRPGRSSSEILIAPFGSDPIRDIPAPHLAAILEHLNGRWDVRLMGLPVQADRLHSLACRIAGKQKPPEVLIPGGLKEYLAEVRDAPLVVSTETATAHIRTACDRPGLFFQGGGHFGQFAPWSCSKRQIWLSHRTDCRGCNWVCPYEEPLCLTGIDIGGSVDAICHLLPKDE